MDILSIVIPVIILTLIIGIVVVSFVGRNNVGAHIASSHAEHQQTKECPASTDPKDLYTCNPANQDQDCLVCKGTLPHSCVVINADNPHKYQSGTGPAINIPDSPTGMGWCLPAEVKTLPCNQFTGFPVLAKKGNDYVWKCQCRDENLFINAGEFGDCIQEVACGAQANSNNYLVCPEGSSFCTPGTKWLDEKNYDPSKAVCHCATGYTTGNNHECIQNTCVPGTLTTEPGSNIPTCNCPDKTGSPGSWNSYILCPSNTVDICSPEAPKCIKDPCNPHGYYDGTKCVCDENYKPYLDSTSLVGYSCYSPCDDANNPCGVGPLKRGDCYYDTVNQKASCRNCTGFWTQQSKEDDPNQLCTKQLGMLGDSCQNDSDCVTKGNGINCLRPSSFSSLRCDFLWDY